jgi:hypothetical protein
LENLLECYVKSDGATKKKILGCIFADKLVLENGRVATKRPKSEDGRPKSEVFLTTRLQNKKSEMIAFALTLALFQYPERTKVTTRYDLFKDKSHDLNLITSRFEL